VGSFYEGKKPGLKPMTQSLERHTFRMIGTIVEDPSRNYLKGQ
jgi:hypothetical protein